LLSCWRVLGLADIELEHLLLNILTQHSNTFSSITNIRVPEVTLNPVR